MTDFARTLYRRDLAARSQLARFAPRGQEEWFQTALPLHVAPRPDANDRSEACGHAGTGRQAQRRLSGEWASVCARCGGEV